jgi:pentatricopeptide repeat protein
VVYTDMYNNENNNNNNNNNNIDAIKWSRTIDTMIQTFTSQAFAPPFDSSNQLIRQRIFLGVNAIQLQLSASSSSYDDGGGGGGSNNIGSLISPYNTVPKRTLLDALKALTALNGEKSSKNRYTSDSFNEASDEAFRMLQRLVTGVGVRYQSSEENNDKKVSDESSPHRHERNSITEQDFNRVLNSFSNAGRMEMVHRVLALQERTPNAPPLSPVAYSILLKGYGRLGDFANVELVLSHAIENKIVPDTILLNSLIDAFVNCNAIDKANEVFAVMKSDHSNVVVSSEEEKKIGDGFKIESWLQQFSCPRPNRRTYNTILKGLSNSLMLEEAFSLTEEMKILRLWDSITTNTIVRASIKVADYQLAENILSNYTVTKWNSQKNEQHPNVEAYTELLDAYAKSRKLDKAVATLQLMQQRGVTPNAITYNCLLGGFGRSGKLEQAKKTLQFMNSTNIKISTKSYNSLISGLVSVNLAESFNQDDASVEWGSEELNFRVDEALKILREMIQFGVFPNDVTASVLVDALGRCNPPRVVEATTLVTKLVRRKFIKVGNIKVATALIQAYGKVGNLEGATIAYNTIRQSDTIAVNAYLDACYRSGRDDVAKETFDKVFVRHNNRSSRPDVISYSILIGALLRRGTPGSIQHAARNYDDMRLVWKIRPDTALIDLILKAMIRYGNQASAFDKSSALFVTTVLNDAETLEWGEGQLERRKRAVQDRLRGIWKREARDAIATPSKSDDLFERKGWNQVDSGFRLWGGGRRDVEKKNLAKEDTTCKFLESHGWNDVNSGFRLF